MKRNTYKRQTNNTNKFKQHDNNIKTNNTLNTTT